MLGLLLVLNILMISWLQGLKIRSVHVPSGKKKPQPAPSRKGEKQKHILLYLLFVPERNDQNLSILYNENNSRTV